MSSVDFWETHWVYVGPWICGVLSEDQGVRRVDGRDRDVLFLPIVVVREKVFSLSANQGVHTILRKHTYMLHLLFSDSVALSPLLTATRPSRPSDLLMRSTHLSCLLSSDRHRSHL